MPASPLIAPDQQRKGTEHMLNDDYPTSAPAWWAGADGSLGSTVAGGAGPRSRAPATVPVAPLSIVFVPGRDVMTVTAAGELDIATRGTLARAVGHALRQDIALLVLDLREVTFIDATGLRSVIGAMERCAARAVRFEVLPGDSLHRLLVVAGETLREANH
jgi:anti-anti-sigma factor